MMQRWIVVAFATLSALVGVVAYHIGRARADGVPTISPLTYGGVLDDGGRPVEGVRSVSVRLWDAASGGTAACTTVAPTTTFSAGRFRVTLDASCTAAVRANPNLWAEVIVDSSTFPRSKVGAVPYALEAGRATGASGALETRIAGIEARSQPRQLEVGETSTMTSVNCSLVYVATTTVPALAMRATATATYRVSTSVIFSGGGSASARLRIGSSDAPTFISRPEMPFVGTWNGPVSVLVRLEAGRTYTFNLEYINSSSSCTFSLRDIDPIVVEQLN